MKGTKGSRTFTKTREVIRYVGYCLSGKVPAGEYTLRDVFGSLNETQQVNVGRCMLAGLVGPDTRVIVYDKVDKKEVKIDKESIIAKAKEMLTTA